MFGVTASFAVVGRESWGKVRQGKVRSQVVEESGKVVLRLASVSRRKGAGREFQLGAKLAHLAEALK